MIMSTVIRMIMSTVIRMITGTVIRMIMGMSIRMSIIMMGTIIIMTIRKPLGPRPAVPNATASR
jgi:hypothetical protein